jgi:hypothetical protein
MTRRKYLLIFGIAIVLFFIGRTAYKIFNFSNSLEAERKNYVRHLSYNFSSRVDSVKLANKDGGIGKIYCTIIDGKANPSIEDSLAKTLQYHTTLRFNEAKTDGLLQFMMPGAERWISGDSIVVNSETNRMTFFRKGTQVYADDFSNLLEGRIAKGY